MELFAVHKVDHDHEGNEWLKLKGVYDTHEKCHDYINGKRTNPNYITLIHKRTVEETEDALDIVYKLNFRYPVKCDYIIEQIMCNENY